MTKEPYGEGTPWKNSVAFYNYLRGCLRSAWSKNPVKHMLIKKMRKQIDNPNPRGNKATVWGFTCAMCNEDFPISSCNVDHIVPAGSLRCKEDIQGFVERLLFVGENDLRLVCKPCNNALSMADKKGTTYEEELIEKQAIAIVKAKNDHKWLEERGITPESTQAKRRIQIIKELSK